MTEKYYKQLKIFADFIIPIINVALMLAVWFLTSFSPLAKFSALALILILGNIAKFELKRKLAKIAPQK